MMITLIRVFFEELELPEPDYRLDIGLIASTHGEEKVFFIA